MMHKTITGFTLVEVVITIALLGLLAITIAAVLNVGDATWRTEMALLGLQQKSRLAIDGMTREIRETTSSDITITGTGLERIDFLIPTSVNTISYYVTDGQLLREHPSGTTKLLADNVTGLDFDLTGEVVTIGLTAAKTEKGRSLSFSLTEQVRLRNE